MSSTRPSLHLAGLLALALTPLVACEKDNPNFCADGDPRPECSADAREIDAATGCMANPGLCTAEEDCVADVCVDCTAANDHQSAECTNADQPVCGTNRDCRACAADTECDSQVCDHGRCAGVGTVLFVKHDGNDGGDNQCGDPAMPCKTVTRALSLVPTGAATADNLRYIKMLTIGTYAEPGIVSINDKRVVIIGAPIIGTGMERSVIDRTNMGATMEVKGGAVVRLERLAVDGATGNGAKGLECKEDATLVADGIEVASNSGIGIVADTCTLTLVNSVVMMSAGGGVSMQNGRMVVVNNVIANNGTSGAAGSSFGGMLIDTMVTPDSVIQSNTVLSNHAATAQSDGLDCRVPSLTTRNHILTGDATRARVAGLCMHSNVLYSPDDVLARLGTANGNMLVANDADFQFVNPALRDFHIKPTSVANGKGTATGIAAEAMKDMDGQPRPQGAPDVGADEIPD